jgi:MGT family glycosyltransferase
VDARWEEVRDKLRSRNGAAAGRVVYCSLGTLCQYQYGRCGDFYHKVIEAFRGRPDLTLVLVTGPFAETYDHDSLPANVHLLKAVPQLQVLPLASLMITHGGMNSMTECIYFGVPVVVYPLSGDFDQRGNAARAEHHGLGVRGNIRRDGVKQIAARVDQVLGNPAYGRRMAEMGQSVRDSGDFDNSVRYLEELMKTKDKEVMPTACIEDTEGREAAFPFENVGKQQNSN